MSRRGGHPKLMNAYARTLEPALYRECPKAVLAAIAVSRLTTGGDFLDEAQERLLEEWNVLAANGIVRTPPKRWRQEPTHRTGT